MLFKLFNNTKPVTILISLTALSAIALASVYIYMVNDDFNSRFSVNAHYPLGDLLASLLSVVLIVSSGSLVSYIVHKNQITGDNSYALMFYVILMASSPSLMIMNPVLLSYFFIALSLVNLLNLHEHRQMTSKLFNAGILIGIAAVLYPYSIFYAGLIYLGIIIYGADNWRQWLFPMIGVVLPYYFLFVWHYWFDSLDIYREKYFIHSFDIIDQEFFSSVKTVISWGIYSLLTLMSLFNYSRNMNKNKLDTRKGYAMTYLALLTGILIVMFGTIKNGQELIMLIMPTSIIWAKNLQHQKKKRWQNVFLLLVIIMISVNYLQ